MFPVYKYFSYLCLSFTLMIRVKCYFYDLDVTLSLVMKMTAISLNYMISRAI